MIERYTTDSITSISEYAFSNIDESIEFHVRSMSQTLENISGILFGMVLEERIEYEVRVHVKQGDVITTINIIS